MNKRTKNDLIIKILSHSGSIPSALILKNAMQVLLNENGIKDTYVLVTKNPEKIKNNMFIRYGCSEPTKFETDLNSPSFIKIATDKLTFSNMVRDVGLFAPEFFTAGVPKEYPVLIRTSLFLSKGKGIIFAENEKDFIEKWKVGYYWTPFIKTNFEMRAHILGGKIVKIFRKESMSEIEKDFPIRNLDNGYHFSMRSLDSFPKMKEPLEKLAELFLPLGGNFFTVDAGWSREKQRYVFFEINSGSGLNENTAIVYAKFLVEKLLNKELKFKFENATQIELPIETVPTLGLNLEKEF